MAPQHLQLTCSIPSFDLYLVFTFKEKDSWGVPTKARDRVVASPGEGDCLGKGLSLHLKSQPSYLLGESLSSMDLLLCPLKRTQMPTFTN